mgnify:CR=1 FL=1
MAKLIFMINYIASQFLAGLEAIQKVGLIHRDIKPENIMLTRAGRVVVMDFGLARQEAEGLWANRRTQTLATLDDREYRLAEREGSRSGIRPDNLHATEIDRTDFGLTPLCTTIRRDGARLPHKKIQPIMFLMFRILISKQLLHHFLRYF